MDTKNKLTEPERLELVRQLAYYQTPTEVQKYVLDKFGKKISLPLIHNTYQNGEKWRPHFERFREEYHRKLSEVPLFNKRRRLDYLQRLFDRSYLAEKSKECLQILEQFRVESEGRSGGDINVNFNQINHTEFHNMSDEDLAREELKCLEDLKRYQRMKELCNIRQQKPIELTAKEEGDDECVTDEKDEKAEEGSEK